MWEKICLDTHYISCMSLYHASNCSSGGPTDLVVSSLIHVHAESVCQWMLWTCQHELPACGLEFMIHHPKSLNIIWRFPEMVVPLP